MENNITLSTLPKTWILDVDGTILVHNGYKRGGDKLIEGIEEFLAQIRKEDLVILITARKKEQKEQLESFLKENQIRFDQIIYDAPTGERILVNDDKPSGLKTAIAINTPRDTCPTTKIERDKTL